MPIQEEPQYIYQILLSITEAEGFRAVFVERHESGFPYLSEEPLIGWGRVQMVGAFEGGDRPLEIDIIGLVATEEVEAADMMYNFMGYVGPTQDRNIYLDGAVEKLNEAEKAANEPDEDDEDESPHTDVL